MRISYVAAAMLLWLAGCATPPPKLADDLIAFGTLKSRYTSDATVEYTIASNTDKPILFYCTGQKKEGGDWKDLATAISSDTRGTNVVKVYPLAAGETKGFVWPDWLPFTGPARSASLYRLKAEIYDSKDENLHLGTSFSKGFSVVFK